MREPFSRAFVTRTRSSISVSSTCFLSVAGGGTALLDQVVDVDVADPDAVQHLALAQPLDHQLVADVVAELDVGQAFLAQALAQLPDRQLVLGRDVGHGAIELGLVDTSAVLARIGDQDAFVDQGVEHLLAKRRGWRQRGPAAPGIVADACQPLLQLARRDELLVDDGDDVVAGLRQRVDARREKRRAAAGAGVEINVAQILVPVPDGASDAVVEERRARAAAALARSRGGEDFATVAREVSEDGNRAQGGEIGLRPADRLPDIFVKTVQSLKPGEIAPELLRSGAGFHVLKLLDRKEAGAFTVAQSRARHILLRPSTELSPEAAARRLLQFKREIQAGTRTFEQLARDNSEDGSAAQGGDLGWTSPGTFVPEFEEAITALPVGGISDPVTTRFGLHLIQVVDRRQATLDVRQQREQAKNLLREQKFDEAFTEWLRDLRGRAYIELRDPPQAQ